MSNTDTKVTELSTEQQKAVIEAKEVLASKQDVLMAIGQIQAFDNMRKYVTVTEIMTYRRIKESKQYKGLVYTNAKGESVTVTDLKDVCTAFFNRSYEQMQEDSKNLEIFGQEFLESAQQMELGYREIRKLRQLPQESQAMIINSEEFDLGDKEGLKEKIEDMIFQHSTEKAELNKQVKEANHTVKAARELSSDKQQELNAMKEQESIRQFSQEPWHRDTLDSVNAMIEARGAISQGANQLLAVLNNLSENHELDDKAIDHIGRSLLSEAQHNLSVISDFCNDAFSILGDRYHPDLTADELFNQLHANEETISAE